MTKKPSQKATTLADIAKYANVAIRTASKVFKNDPTVRPYIRERVLSVAKEHDYTPNLVAMALREKKLPLISFHISDLNNPFFGFFFEKVSKRLADLGYMTTPCDGVDAVNEANQRAFACATILFNANSDKIKKVIQDGPLISVDSYGPQLDVASEVAIDLKWAYSDMTRKALDGGRSKFAVFCFDFDFEPNRRKFVPVWETLAEAGIEMGRIEDHWLSTYEAVRDAVEKGEVDTIFCSNDHRAASLVFGLLELGCDIRRSVQIIGCDGTFEIPGVWTMKVDFDAFAQATVDILMKTLKDPNHKKELVLLKPELVTD